MPNIDDYLDKIGDRSIIDLFLFVQEWYETSKRMGDAFDQLSALRTLTEVSEAIVLFGKWKEKQCQK